MSNFILGILLPLPCDDPYIAVERVMKGYEGEGNIDGWTIKEFQFSKRVDATPYAFVDLDGTWSQREEEYYQEEKAYTQQMHVLVQAHLEQYGQTNFALLRQRMNELPTPITDWHRTWQRVAQEKLALVAFVWCHV